YKGQYLSEIQARNILNEAGIVVPSRPKGIPENFKIKISDKGAGIEYIHPINMHIRVRVMSGKPHSLNGYQQKPYVIYKKNGNTVNKFGDIVNPQSEAAHIPFDEFIYIGN
ncbi:MAG: hypothetical protein WCG10_04460, partial [Chlamydiota bacterium]